MAKKRSRTSRMSSGKKASINKAREAKRQARFAEKRENGTAYVYEPIKAKKGTSEYNRERLERADKAKSSRTPYAQWQTIMARLDYELAKAAIEAKEKKEKKARKSKPTK